ncbi:MAG: P27 family phage terminase small subunit [Pseudomonadota bacterium]|nr:P27 family phage terminase small subunit [Pseudomonadota bacterium]NKX20621.1 hypothetical protein [Alteromonadaceae bacterium A_SAG2]|tara:strand:- start:978 stop:1364 length:387 start_codon:yes stop_codon:yes gene_type:complete
MTAKKSALELVLQGTARKDRQPVKVKQAKEYSFPRCPRHIKGQAKSVWHDVAKEMDKFQVITGADKSILEQYCQLMSQFRTKPEEFTASLHAQLKGLANDLYLTPASRSKLSFEEPNPLDEYDKKYGL